MEVNLRLSFDIKVTAEKARQTVNQWLLREVSYLMWAEPPMLAVGGEFVCWRVPVSLGYPSWGRVGSVGAVEVDVVTGEIKNPLEQKAELEKQGMQLSARFPLERSPVRAEPPAQ